MLPDGRGSVTDRNRQRRDRDLGMDRSISRRDFIQGAVGSLVAGATLSTGCAPDEGAPRAGPPDGQVGMPGVPGPPSSHPPSRLGLRGSHPGSFEVAHAMALEKRSDWGPVAEPDAGEYDLVVVGAGISGLAAAFFYREQHPDARVLLLDNHDDFGGHAKRNEFEVRGRTILGYGGSQSLEAPSAYSDVARGLLEKLRIDTQRLRDAYDVDFFRRNDLGGGIFFDAATYGTDRFVRSNFANPDLFMPVARSDLDAADAIDQMPLSAPARQELRRLIVGSDDRLPDHSLLGEPGFLRSISYRDFLTEHLGVEQPEVLAFLQEVPGIYHGHGIDAVPALDALGFGLPGLGSTSLGSLEGVLRKVLSLALEPYLYHFPDGNASVARELVRRLVPVAGAGTTMEDGLIAPIDYGVLDRPDNEVRLRLESTVVRVEHDGDPRQASGVSVHYLRAGRSERVRAGRVVLACYNAAIPHLCPSLPDLQKQALRKLVKVPLVFTNVLLRSWHACQKQGLGVALCPGSWHSLAALDFPVSLGEYRFSTGPDDPIVLHLSRAVAARHPGTPDEQSRLGRFELLSTSFETIEREIRTHLAGMLGPGGFDPAIDIEAIAVNRWPHGYARSPNPLFDPEYEPGEAPHEIGRKPFGRIAIANSDAGASAYLDAAIDQAWRAVGDLA